MFLIAVTVIINAAIGIGVAVLLKDLQSQSNYDHTVVAELIDELAELKFQVVQIQQFETDSAATGEDGGMEEARAALKAAQQAAQKIGRADPQYADRVTRIAGGTERMYAAGEAMVAAYRESREAGNAMMQGKGGFDEQSTNLQGEIDAIEKEIVAQRQLSSGAVDMLLTKVRWLAAGLSLALAILIAAMSYLIYHRVMASIGAEPGVGAKLAGRLAEGDLRTEIRLRSGDQHSLLAGLQTMQKRWRDVVGTLRGQSSMMLSSSGELSVLATQLAANGEEQSSAAERIAAAIEELSASIDVVADQSGDAANVARATGEASVVASLAIERVVNEVNGAAESVRSTADKASSLDATATQISAAAELIREVADQTNLIALNAAIEAARAGEQGRGFAVVADEVRKLAERTGAATTDIGNRIESIRRSTQEIVDTMRQSVSRVEAGVALTGDALRDIRNVRQQAEISAGQVAEIDHALKEQRQTAREIAQATEGVAVAARDNAEAAGRVSANSQNISEVATALNADVAYFKLAETSSDIDLF